MSNSSEADGNVGLVVVGVSLVVLITMVIVIVVVCNRIVTQKGSGGGAESRLLTLTMDKFLKDLHRKYPIKFTSQQLQMATHGFTTRLGSGGFGAVYKGAFSNGTVVAVKVLHACSHERIEEQFIAEVSTVGSIHHPNLARLYGYCFEKKLKALVYEYMENGSLDKLLFQSSSSSSSLGLQKLNEIAIGTAKGMAFLHEEMIVHYDIKPGNILMDAEWRPKLGDFGLARLCSRESAHVPATGGRGTPGYAAPELWAALPVTHKCDVYSFGMLLLEILGRRRNLDASGSGASSQEWFPKWVWAKFANAQLGELMSACGVEAAEDMETAERMGKVALWCVQHTAESRPVMSVVVKMLEGAVDIPNPVDPFQGVLLLNNFPAQLPLCLHAYEYDSGY